jgi:hypothetical protein
LENFILDDLREMAQNTVKKTDFNKKVGDKVKSFEKGLKTREQRINKEAELLKAKNRDLLKLLAQGAISKDGYRSVVDENQRKVQELQQKLVITKKQLNDQNDNTEIITRIMNIWTQYYRELNEELIGILSGSMFKI